MKKIFFLILTIGISLIFSYNETKAQAITGPALYGPLGGARILNAQGETAANPAIGFSGVPGAFPANLNDGGGGNGIFRPEANVMAFSTLSKERMRISPGGNLGIGITYPTATLDINGNQGNTASSVNFRVTYNQPGNISLVGTEFSALRNLQLTHQGTVNSWAAMYAKAGTAEYAGVFDGKTYFNGNVGIGTTTPSAKLQIMGASATSFTFDASTSTSGYTAGFKMDNTALHIGHNSLIRDLNFYTGNVTRMTIGQNGKVGIGLDPAVAKNFAGNYKLYVKDGILTEKLKVALNSSSNWADYVFAKGYKLKPLEEVEKFIKKEQHLPNFPSADELVKQGGIDMTDMFAKQMEKIEELTLYIIEQNNELKTLNNRINQLEKK